MKKEAYTIDVISYKNGFITLTTYAPNGLIHAKYDNLKQSYLGYTKKQAIKDFKKYINDNLITT